MEHHTRVPQHHTTVPQRRRTARGAARRRTARRPALTFTVLGLALSLVAGCGPGPTDDPSASGSTAGPSASPSARVSPTGTASGASASPTQSASPGPSTQAPTLVVPSQAALPQGPFRVRATSASGASPSVSAGPGDVCALEAARVRPLRLGACVVSASAGGLTTVKTVQIVKGTPKITWALRKVTPHSGDPRPHGIRSTSDGRVTIRSLTPTQCEIRGSKIKAVARELDSVTSLGPCKVRVDVAETPQWKAAETVLSSRIVEAAVSLAFVEVPATLRLDANAEVVLKFTHPDSSIDNELAVTLDGCGASTSEKTVDEIKRLVTFRFLVQAPDGDPQGSRCTLSASTFINGQTKVVGRGETSATVRLVGEVPSPAQAS